MKQSKNNRGNGQRRQNRGDKREQNWQKTPVESFTYEKRGLTGAVHISMMSGHTVQVQISDPSVGIRTLQSKLRFYTAYTTENLKQVFDAIRAHAQELKLIETISSAIKTNGGRLQLGDTSFLIVEETMEANAALAKILAKATSFAPAQTPGKNGSKVPADQRQIPNA